MCVADWVRGKGEQGGECGGLRAVARGCRTWRHLGLLQLLLRGTPDVGVTREASLQAAYHGGLHVTRAARLRGCTDELGSTNAVCDGSDCVLRHRRDDAKSMHKSSFQKRVLVLPLGVAVAAWT